MRPLLLLVLVLSSTACAHRADQLAEARRQADRQKRSGWGVPAAHVRRTRAFPNGTVSILGWARDGSAFGAVFSFSDGFCGATQAVLVDASGTVLDSDRDGHCDVITPEIQRRSQEFDAKVQGWTTQRGLDVDPATAQPGVRVDGASELDEADDLRSRDTARALGWAGPAFELRGAGKVQLRSASGALLGSAEVPGDDGVLVPVGSPDGARIAWVAVRHDKPWPALQVVVTPAR